MKLTAISPKRLKNSACAITLLASCLSMSACTEYLSNINIPNPFEQKQAQSIDAVYYGHFNDIPIPVDMEKDVNNTKVVFYNQQVSGVEKYEGRVEIISLSNAMEQNLLKNNWTLIAKEHDEKIMQVYQKDNRFAILTFYDQTLTTGMEVWVLDKLPQNMIKTNTVTPAKPRSTPQDKHLTPNSSQKMQEMKQEDGQKVGQKIQQEATETIDTTVKKAENSIDSLDKAVEQSTITIDTTKEEIKTEVKQEINQTTTDIIL